MFLTSFTGQNLFNLIFYLVVLVGILFVAYYVTKWIAGNQKTRMYNKNFEVIETFKITNNKYLQIVRVGTDDYYVISIGKDEIHLLGKVPAEKLDLTSSTPVGGGFSDILKSFQAGKNTSGDDIQKDKGTDDED